MKTVYAVEFIFENCESAFINIQNIFLKTGEIKQKIHRVGGIFNTFAIECTTDFIEFTFTDKNLTYISQMYSEETKINFLERLYVPDIVSIVLHYEDSEIVGTVQEYSISVPWKRNLYTNKLQKLESRNGIYKVTIKRRNIWTKLFL